MIKITVKIMVSVRNILFSLNNVLIEWQHQVDGFVSFIPVKRLMLISLSSIKPFHTRVNYGDM